MKRIVYIILVIVVIFMLIHIEFSLKKEFAPENVLVKVDDGDGGIEENATCFGDIESGQVNVENKALRNLKTIYDFVDPKVYFIEEDRGYYLLETGFEEYQGEFDIQIVCYSPGFSGVSYTIINNTNKNCDFSKDGDFIIC